MMYFNRFVHNYYYKNLFFLATNFFTGAFFGQGSRDIVLDNVGCDGSESRLEDCPKSLMTAQCTHAQDAGVSCEREWALKYILDSMHQHKVIERTHNMIYI